MSEIVNLVVSRQWEKALLAADSKEYTKLKYLDKIYKLNDTILINPDPHQPLIVEKVAKITRIVSLLADNLEVPLLKVQLYCDKREIPMTYADYLACMSSNELFLTEQESKFKPKIPTRVLLHRCHPRPLLRLRLLRLREQHRHQGRTRLLHPLRVQCENPEIIAASQ